MVAGARWGRGAAVLCSCPDERLRQAGGRAPRSSSACPAQPGKTQRAPLGAPLAAQLPQGLLPAGARLRAHLSQPPLPASHMRQSGRQWVRHAHERGARSAPAVALRRSSRSVSPAGRPAPPQAAGAPFATHTRPTSWANQAGAQAPHLATQLLELFAGRQPPARHRLRPLARLPRLLFAAAPPHGSLLGSAGECKAIGIDILLRPGGHCWQSRASWLQHRACPRRNAQHTALAGSLHPWALALVSNRRSCWLPHSKVSWGSLRAACALPLAANQPPAIGHEVAGISKNSSCLP